MNQAFHNILTGMGSVIELAPAERYERFVPRQDPGERMARPWRRTGRHLQTAMNRFADEQQETGHEKNRA